MEFCLECDLKSIDNLSQNHQDRLRQIYENKIDLIKRAIKFNGDFAKILSEDWRRFLSPDLQTSLFQQFPTVESTDYQIANLVFKHIFREWSIEGESERNLILDPIINQLNELYPLINPNNDNDNTNKHGIIYWMHGSEFDNFC